MNSQITRYAFLSGAAYFVFMAVAHFVGVKVPVLFIYYDTPYYSYQDKIISFAVIAYVALFYAAAKHRDVAVLAIIVLALTVAGLCAVNVSNDLGIVLDAGQSTAPYWIQTGAIAVYLVILALLYARDGKNS